MPSIICQSLLYPIRYSITSGEYSGQLFNFVSICTESSHYQLCMLSTQKLGHDIIEVQKRADSETFWLLINLGRCGIFHLIYADFLKLLNDINIGRQGQRMRPTIEVSSWMICGISKLWWAIKPTSVLNQWFSVFHTVINFCSQTYLLKGQRWTFYVVPEIQKQGNPGICNFSPFSEKLSGFIEIILKTSVTEAPLHVTSKVWLSS